MQALTDKHIIDIGSQTAPGINLHPSAIKYIQLLVTPYAEAIDTDTDVQSIEDRIYLTCGIESTMNALREINKEIAKARNSAKDEVNVAKITAVENVVAEIIGMAVDTDISLFNPSLVTALEIQVVVSDDMDLSEMLCVIPETRLLPIDVIINDEKFTHQFTIDMICGLLLFSAVSGHDFHVTVFGAYLDPSYMRPELGNASRFYLPQGVKRGSFGKDDVSYAIKVGNYYYGFDDPVFIQGFATGAAWLGVDHHVYWSELKDYATDAKGVSITF